MTAATGRRGSLETSTVDPDCLTREEYMRLNGAAINTDTPRNGAKSPEEHGRVPPSVATAERPRGAERAADALRSCGWCGEPLAPDAHRGAKYCSARHRNAARDARVKAQLAAVNGNGVAPVAESLAAEPAARASVAAASPGPAVADGIAPLVVELLALGAGDVELERGGWRLRVHPR